jgi:GT2 family glycosyltransferase
LLILNPDTTVSPNLFCNFGEITKNLSSEIAAIECRQLPFDHPKVYNTENGETEWFSGAAVFIKQQVYGDLGGFDELLFPMYCNDVDLSIRVRMLGLKIIFCSNLKVVHNKVFNDFMQIKTTNFEVIESLISKIILLRKYGLEVEANEILSNEPSYYDQFINDFRMNLVEPFKFSNFQESKFIKEFLIQPNFGRREY